jgi:hypothetical protein
MKESADSLPALIAALEMTPRQAMEFFRILGHLSSTNEEPTGFLHIGYGVGMMLMSAFKVSKPELYQQLGEGYAPHKEVIQIFKDAYDNQSARSWSFTYLCGFTDLSPAHEQLEAVGLLSTNATTVSTNQEVQRHIRPIWGTTSHLSDKYPEFHAMIESRELLLK